MPAAAAIRRKVVTVEPVLFAYMLSLVLHNTASQQLLFTKYCYRYYQNATSSCDNDTATDQNYALQDSTSQMRLYCTLAAVLPSILVCTYLGTWSDNRSRKYPMLVPLIGAVTAYGLWAVQSFFLAWDPRYSAISNFILGSTGYYVGSVQTCYSYLTAIVTPDARTSRIAVAEVTLAISLLVGSFAAGPALQRLGATGTYVALSAINLAAGLYCAAWIDEIRPRVTTAAAAGSASFWSLRPIRDFVKCVLKKRENHSTLYIHLALAAFFLSYCGSDGASNVQYLFLTKVQGFSIALYGYFTGADFAYKLFVGVLFLACARRFFRAHDLTLAAWGSMSGALSYGLLAASVRSWMSWLASALGALQLLFSVGIRSFVSKTVPDEDQGKIFAFTSLGQSVSTVLSALLFNTVYQATVGVYAGICFVISSALCFASFILLIVLGRRVRRRGAYEEIRSEDSRDDRAQDGVQ